MLAVDCQDLGEQRERGVTGIAEHFEIGGVLLDPCQYGLDHLDFVLLGLQRIVRIPLQPLVQAGLPEHINYFSGAADVRQKQIHAFHYKAGMRVSKLGGQQSGNEFMLAKQPALMNYYMKISSLLPDLLSR